MVSAQHPHSTLYKVICTKFDVSLRCAWPYVTGLIHDVPTCAHLLRQMVADAEEIINGRLQALVSSPPRSKL